MPQFSPLSHPLSIVFHARRLLTIPPLPDTRTAPRSFELAVASPTPTRPTGVSNPSPTSNMPCPPSEAPMPMPRATFMSRPGFHQPHVSNGGLVFGAFHDSSNSPPAPMPGGGFAPPGIPCHPAMPLASLDAYGRPVLMSPTLDGYPSSVGTHRGPPTPHSFHDSQSSVPTDEHSSFARYPVLMGHDGRYGKHGGLSSTHVLGSGCHTNGASHTAAPSLSNASFPVEKDKADFLGFMRKGIMDMSFTDCILDILIPSNPHDPTKSGHHAPHLESFNLRGHRYILSRSRTLARLMMEQGVGPGGHLHMELLGKHFRGDVLRYALFSLYGVPLAPESFPRHILPCDFAPRNVVEDFELTLSYLATGGYLQLDWVVSLATDRAVCLLWWETIELAAAFLSNWMALNTGSEDERIFWRFRILVVEFIVSNMPKSFVPDGKAGDCGFSRFPVIRAPSTPPAAHSTTDEARSNQPSKANLAQMPRNMRSPHANLRLSQIQFGDVEPAVTNGAVPPSPQSAQAGSHSPPSTINAILSRILLNVPFNLLKEILEHPRLAGFESNSFRRLEMVTMIIAARESQRTWALHTANTELRVFQDIVDKTPKPLNVKELGDFYVNSMGFKEDACSGDIPYLVHTWSGGDGGSPVS